MDYERQFKARFLALFCLVGLINIFLISQIYFFETRKALINRASSQLVSIRGLYQSRFTQIHDFHAARRDINSILEYRPGMGMTGEVYLVDSDHQIRSSSRFGPQWLNSKIINEATQKAVQSHNGVSIVKDYRGVDVISAYGPILFEGKLYGLLCEMDLDEVLHPLRQTKKKVILISAILILITFLVSLFFSSKMINFLRRMKDQITHLNNENALRVIEGQEHERAKISHDIHDGIGQMVTSLKWQLSLKNTNGNQNDDLIDLCDKVLSEVRSISQNVIPPSLKDFGIFVTLDEMSEKFTKIESPKITFHLLNSVRDLHLKNSFELNLYRIVQELMQNAFKHAQAKKINLTLKDEESMLVVSYQDDGVGLKGNDFPPRSLAYRVKLFDGDLAKQETTIGLHILIKFKLADILNENIHY